MAMNSMVRAMETLKIQYKDPDNEVFAKKATDKIVIRITFCIKLLSSYFVLQLRR